MPGMLEGMSGVSTGLLHNGMDLLFPPSCLFCHKPVSHRQSCCEACAREIQLISHQTCHRCGQPLPEELAPGPCGRCLMKPPPQQETISLFTYAGPVRQALLAWKLEGRNEGLLWLLDAARPKLLATFKPEDLLLPIPMPLKRMRKAGQHHAADLCRHIAAMTHSSWEWRLLRREGEQARQSSLRGPDRQRNLRAAFSVDMEVWNRLDVRGHIWVLDDIHTTGSTLRFGSRALTSLWTPVNAFALSRVGPER